MGMHNAMTRTGLGKNLEEETDIVSYNPGDVSLRKGKAPLLQ